mgnify:CR=1 FL=1
MKILKKEDIKKCITMSEAIEVCKTAMINYTLNNSDIPLRTSIKSTKNNGQILFMPGKISTDTDNIGIKIVSVYPNNIKKNLPSVPSTIVTLDETTGIVNGLLDGTYLTALRTAALQGAATDLLAKKDSTIATLIGTGGQAIEQALALISVRKLKELRVVARNFINTQNFVEHLKEQSIYSDIDIIPCKNVNDAIKNSDIITTVTTSKTPTFSTKYLKPGAHINGIGSFTHEMIELPPELINKHNKIYFDTNNGVLNEAGDILYPLEKGLVSKDDFKGELGELLLELIIGRENNDEFTIFKSVGTAALDIACADYIIKKANKMKIGTVIDL